MATNRGFPATASGRGLSEAQAGRALSQLAGGVVRTEQAGRPGEVAARHTRVLGASVDAPCLTSSSMAGAPAMVTPSTRSRPMPHGASPTRNARGARASAHRLAVAWVPALLTTCLLPSHAVAQCEVAQLTAPHGDLDNLFGGTVAIDGDVIVVRDSTAFDSSGAASVFRFDGVEWVLEAVLTIPELGDRN